MAVPKLVRTPQRILVLGWIGFMVYAFPGFMSFDSVYQLRQSRWGYFTDSHPPFMAVLWSGTEVFITGPVGMLIIQVTAFLTGAFLAFRQAMPPRRAALMATLVLWFPPVASFMAVVWKDSQMAGFLLLGFGLMLEPGRIARVLALVALLIATLMRHNALIATAPLVVMCWSWNPGHRWLQRYTLAASTWLGITLAAHGISSALTDEHSYLWHSGPALIDIAGTLRQEDANLSDQQLRQLLPGVAFQVENVHAYLKANDVRGSYMNVLLAKTFGAFKRPTTQAERDAVAHAWQTTVFGNLRAYASHRWGIARRLLGVTPTGATPVYNWFTDVQDRAGSAAAIAHDAAGAGIQNYFRQKFQWLGQTWLFWLPLYLIVAIALIPLAFADRRILAMVASGLISEAGLVLIAPTIDWRYSSWLVVSVVMSLGLASALPVWQRLAARARPHSA